MTPTRVRRAAGQPFGRPSGVAAQSSARMRSPSAPPSWMTAPWGAA